VKGVESWIARRKTEGKREYQYLGRVTSVFEFKEARAAAEKWFTEKGEGVKDGNATIADACLAYVEDRRTEKSEKSAHDALKRFERTVFGTPFGATPLAKLKHPAIKAWRNSMVEPASHDKKPLSKAAGNRTMTALKAALNLAVDNDLVSAAKKVDWAKAKQYPKEESSKRRDLYLDLKQRQALLEAAAGAVRDLIEATMLTGARAGELTSALRSQFDQRSGTLTLRGKTGERQVPLSAPAAKLFERLAKSKLPFAHLLVRDDGKKWNHSDWDELVRDAAKEAKLPSGVCLFTMRHSFITTALQGGLAVSDLSRLVGTSTTMIERNYHHLIRDHVRERLAGVMMS